MSNTNPSAWEAPAHPQQWKPCAECNEPLECGSCQTCHKFTAQAPIAPVPMLDDPISESMRERLIAANLPVTADGILMLWQQTKQKLATLKEDEMEIRKTAVKVYVPQAQEGTNTVKLGNGYALKAVVKYNYNLDPDNAKVEAALDAITALGNEGPFIAERLVNWTPTFLLTEYRKLRDDAEGGSGFAKACLNIISKILTITEASPTLELKEPKAKKK